MYNICLYGKIPIFSSFRTKKYLAKLQIISPKIAKLHTQHIYFLTSKKQLTHLDISRIGQLLQATETPNLPKTDNLLLVLPRPGLIPPWSTKAIDILHHCELPTIYSIYRANAYLIDGEKDLYTKYPEIAETIADRMIEIIETELKLPTIPPPPRPLQKISLENNPVEVLTQINDKWGLALSADEINYLINFFNSQQRPPTDAELMMFAQANSEHCRHKIFNASWFINNIDMVESLFKLIQKTFYKNPGRVLSAYKDNAAITAGYQAGRFYPDPNTNIYQLHPEKVHLVIKVETHNHPTAISPYPGAATGTGGELRDEAATGQGAIPKAGLIGFAVSNLYLPNAPAPWEEISADKPNHIASALKIMLEAPIGATTYGNEFGRPTVCGYFRTFEQYDQQGRCRSYHKPIMLAGGYGSICPTHIEKKRFPDGTLLVILGGPSMLIGLGGGASSSVDSGKNKSSLDFASVQRDNAQMQRCCQEVINHCWALEEQNPIYSIHDVGAGGLSNALSELVYNNQQGAEIILENIPVAQNDLSPMERWCNESQERYVLAIDSEHINKFTDICQRERAPYAIVGKSTKEQKIILKDQTVHQDIVNLPLSILFEEPPKKYRNITTCDINTPLPFNKEKIELGEAISRVLQLPAVASKTFLITIADRSVSGLITRDQMIGPWQIPVADCAVTMSGFEHFTGEAMAIGERPPIALLNPSASGRIAICEAVTNIASARIMNIRDIALSANWMAAADESTENDALYQTVNAVSEYCQELGLAIPVGKDSLSMKTEWKNKTTIAPLSVNITAFAPVIDIRRTLTPELQPDIEGTMLLLIDLSDSKNRLGGSALAQVYRQLGDAPPDLKSPQLLSGFFHAIQLLNENGYLLAYHDRSDGGALVTLLEMAWSCRIGLDIKITGQEVLNFLFNEEPGAIIQIKRAHQKIVLDTLKENGLSEKMCMQIATLNHDLNVQIFSEDKRCLYREELLALQVLWSNPSYQIKTLRDHIDCVNEEHKSLSDKSDLGLFVKIEGLITTPPMLQKGAKPRVAILREQGVNGQIEMAAAFNRAGFTAVDIHMSELLAGNTNLDDISGLAVCGGFSYGDVLGAGQGWAQSILSNTYAKEMFTTFFNNPNTFALGVCNGCQMLSLLKEIIPGAKHWPKFIKNKSEQFESRLVMVEVNKSPSVLLATMQDTKLPIVVAHGEGCVDFNNETSKNKAHVSLRYLDNQGHVTERYPANPNGSNAGIAGLTNQDGRFTIMMPHPERVFLRRQFSWYPEKWQGEESPWMQCFYNARRFLT